jgi:hypothetical protein
MKWIQWIECGCLLLMAVCLNAQGAYDGYMKGKGNTDIALTYSWEQYNQYYFGEEIQDIEVTTQTMNAYLTSGLNSQLDLVVSIPYMWTDSLNRNFQDAVVAIKYRNKRVEASKGAFNMITGVGMSFPLGAYSVETDRPIGVRATAFQPRLIAQYESYSGWFIHLQSGFDFRILPDQQFGWPLILRTGYAGSRIYADWWLDYFNTFNAGVDQQVSGGSGAVWLKTGGTVFKPLASYLGLFVGGAFILDGRNIGKSYRINAGMVWRFSGGD